MHGVQGPQHSRYRDMFFPLFQQWCELRGIRSLLVRQPDIGPWAVFSFRGQTPVEAGPDWVTAYHGTFFYALWSVLRTGILAEGNEHAHWESGVQVTPSMTTALWYARPHVLFRDRTFHRCVIHVLVNKQLMSKARRQGGHLQVFPADAVAVTSVWIWANSGCDHSSVEGFGEWEPELEAVPPESQRLPPTLNPGALAIEGWDAEKQFWHVEDATGDKLGPQSIGAMRNSDPERQFNV